MLKGRLIFIATTPFAVNTFLKDHILKLNEIFDIYLIVNKDAYKLDDEISSEIEVIHVPILRDISIIKDLIILFKFVQIFNARKPHIVHSITPKAGLLTMLAGFLTGVPNRIHTFTGQVWINKTGLMRHILKFCDRLIVLCATKLFSDSVSQSNFLRSENILLWKDISVLGSGSIAGVDPERFKKNISIRKQNRFQFNIDDQAIIFLFVGRIIKAKGIYDLLNAFQIVCKQFAHCQLWIVGPDEKGIAKRLEIETNQKKLPVKWIGPTFNPEQFYMTADVLILPSYQEGFGMVVIEAASCELPCIAYNIVGVRDAIISGKTGILLDKGDILGLAEIMISLVIDRNKIQYLGENARKFVLEKYSKNLIIGAWYEFYERMAKNLKGQNYD